MWYNVDDPNFLNGGTKLLAKVAATSADIVANGGAAATLGHDYYFRVDTYDPDTCGDGEDYVEGSLWTYNTINTGPSVEAGFDLNAWLVSGSVTVDLNGIVTDVDNYPGPLTWIWSSTGGSIDDNLALDTTITFTATGSYTVTLDGNDGALPDTDSFVITVYAEGSASGYLEAHYPFDTDPNDATGNDPT